MPSAIVMHAPGPPDVLKFEEVNLQQPQSLEVVVRHTAIGVNFHDAYVRSGLYKTLALPGVPGIEAAGVVEAVGASVSDVRLGDRVAYVSRSYGAYAEKRVIGQESLVLLPPNVSDEVVAATLLKGLTVQMLIEQVYRVQKRRLGAGPCRRGRRWPTSLSVGAAYRRSRDRNSKHTGESPGGIQRWL